MNTQADALVTVESTTSAREIIPQQAGTDQDVVNMWLHGKAKSTIKAYRLDWDRFNAWTNGKEIRAITLGDLQGWQVSMDTFSVSRRNRAMTSIKSLLTFAHQIGYLTFNPGKAVQLERQKDRLAERIMDEVTIHEMLVKEANPRNRAMLMLLYYGGLRVAEVVALSWADLSGHVLTVYGKGSKTRYVKLPERMVEALDVIRYQDEGAIFRSRKGGGHLDESAAWRVVKQAAKRVGVEAASPHWFRHSHASHSLDRGAPVSLVQATLGHASLATTSRYTHAKPGESSGDFLS